MSETDIVYRLPRWMKVPLPKGKNYSRLKNLIPDPLDWEEPGRLAETIKTLALNHCVITSVARDDLRDGGMQSGNHRAIPSTCIPPEKGSGIRDTRAF